jgi:preprotein translocase subunit SecD
MSLFRKRPLLWLLLAIPFTCLLLAFAFPNLGKFLPDWAPSWTGLSFRGGSQFVAEVDVASLNGGLRNQVMFEIRDKRFSLTRPLQVTAAGVDIFLSDKDREAALSRLAGQFDQSKGFVMSKGEGGAVRIAYSEALLASRMDEAAELSARIIETRLSELGGFRLTNLGGFRLSVRPQSHGKILVQVSQAGDLKRLIDFATRPGRLHFRLLSRKVTPEQALAASPPPGSEILYRVQKENRLPYVVEQEILVFGSDVVDARPDVDARTLEPNVLLRLNAAGARRFAQATTENVGRSLAFVLDGEVISAPVIREPVLAGSLVISGDFSAQAASELAILLRTGALPVSLRPVAP